MDSSPYNQSFVTILLPLMSMGTEAVKLQNDKIISDLFQQGCIKLIRPYSKDIYNKYSYF